MTAAHSSGGGIVIGGFYRSGTTLVRHLLDGHSRIYCGPEAKLWMDLFGLYRGDPLGHLRFFRTMRTLGADDELLVAEFGAAYVRVLDRVAESAGKARWADKAPENVRFLHQWELLIGRDFPFVFCLRDPRDVIASSLEANFKFTLPADIDELSRMYVAFMEAGLDYEAENPQRTIRVRYEDLVADPIVTLRNLMTFLGEDFEEGALDLTDPGTPGALEDPKSADHARVHTHSVGRYATVLTDQQLAVVASTCGEVADRLGYRW